MQFDQSANNSVSSVYKKFFVLFSKSRSFRYTCHHVRRANSFLNRLQLVFDPEISIIHVDPRKLHFQHEDAFVFHRGYFFFFIEILFIPFPATIYFPRWSFGNAFLEEHLSFYITCNGYKTLDGYKKKNTRRWREGEAARC